MTVLFGNGIMLGIFKNKKIKKRIVLRPKGEIYNLLEIYETLNHEYFDAKLDLRISWFGRGEIIPKTRMTFGAYNHDLKLIKINRLLDKPHIPEYFVRYIVYHEMLHNAFPPKRKKRGTHHIHHSDFKAKEKAFPFYQQARAFIKDWKKIHFDKYPSSS